MEQDEKWKALLGAPSWCVGASSDGVSVSAWDNDVFLDPGRASMRSKFSYGQWACGKAFRTRCPALAVDGDVIAGGEEWLWDAVLLEHLHNTQSAIIFSRVQYMYLL